jgi:uncharacterized membrane protein
MFNKLKSYFTGGWNHFFKIALQGLFWLAPIVAILMVVTWLYGKIDQLTEWLFSIVGLNPQQFQFLWMVLALSLLLVSLYIVGHLMETRAAALFEKLFSNIPGYATLKELIGIFNSSKKGEKRVLVVAIRGFAAEGYNIGLMYSQKESIIKDHYTVTLSQTPIPNGGYLFEVHKSNIFLIEEASFDHNVQYLLAMGVKSLAQIVKTAPKPVEELTPLEKWLEKNPELQ